MSGRRLLKRGLIGGAAAIVAIVLAVGGASEPEEAPEAAVASCDRSAPSIAGLNAERPDSLAAGPVRIPGRPLTGAEEVRSGQLAATVPVLVSGHRYVVLSVPLALRDRVFLYRGQGDVAPGRPVSALRGPGYAEIELQPCRDLRRTVWPIGLRLTGRGPVSLLATIEGQQRSRRLFLGSTR